MTVEATAADKVEAEMRRRGILVSSVTPETLPYASPADPVADDGAHIESISAGAAFKVGFFGGFGAMASWIVLWLIIGAVLTLFGVTAAGLSRLFGF